ncbi:MAG: MBL fold metallo-hydrolase [Rothia sp. (in: high G+C Gram-positive bacteria)]|uniref:ComEC/Rec2 family competence protein n=1 Tax=Rothia sp. (in: high G+C Gram-positive bacteria) TaxID=1885016 RepID=UPI0027069687|nr:MBL fold metallo-hydrolase [Rothia sp. (in: high G+C Gram-positive bacteria)]
MNRRRHKALIDTALITLVIGLAVFLLHDRWPASHRAPDHWQWITCDVGQGDAHLIRTGQRSAYLLDTGDDYSALKSCLDWAGVDQLEAVLITHAHSDHDGALQQVQGDFAQPTLVTSPHYSRQGEQTPGAQGAIAYRLAAGSVFPSESVTAERHEVADHPLGRLLWPPEQAQRIPGATGSSSWINNSSLVIHWSLPARETGQRPLTVLTTGDLEADAAHRLLAESAGQVPADVLKIAHHGSAGSGTDLIIAASPSLVLIPVGVGNSYGHPHDDILTFLNRGSIPAARTDLSGHLALTTSDRGIEVTSSG